MFFNLFRALIWALTLRQILEMWSSNFNSLSRTTPRRQVFSVVLMSISANLKFSLSSFLPRTRWWVTDCREHSLIIFLCYFTASLPSFCFIFFHSSFFRDECFFCKRIHSLVFFFLGLCPHQSLVNVTLQFCNHSQAFFIEALPTLLPTDDFPRLFSEPLGMLFLDTTLQLLRFLFQILKFFNLVINCVAVSRL